MVQQVTDNRLPLAKIHHFLFQKERNLGEGSDYLLKPENHLIPKLNEASLSWAHQLAINNKRKRTGQLIDEPKEKERLHFQA
jgi:hypothetical protein